MRQKLKSTSLWRDSWWHKQVEYGTVEAIACALLTGKGQNGSKFYSKKICSCCVGLGNTDQLLGTPSSYYSEFGIWKLVCNHVKLNRKSQSPSKEKRLFLCRKSSLALSRIGLLHWDTITHKKLLLKRNLILKKLLVLPTQLFFPPALSLKITSSAIFFQKYSIYSLQI